MTRQQDRSRIVLRKHRLREYHMWVSNAPTTDHFWNKKIYKLRTVKPVSKQLKQAMKYIHQFVKYQSRACNDIVDAYPHD